MRTDQRKIGIIGLGYVGSAVRHWFENQKNGPPLFFYDKHKNIGSLDEVNKADIIFVAVPTPFNLKSGYDNSAVEKSVANIKDSKIIVIKSTMLPGTTANLQKKYPNKKILFNPEFLRTKTSVEDFINPDRQIIGITQESKGEADLVLELLPKASYTRVIPSTEAETVKYFGNLFLSTKVIFANQIYDLCSKLGINYDIVKDCAALDPRIGFSHLDVNDDGYRGYGGGCFPKDVKAFIQLARQKGLNPKLLETIEEINKELNGDTWCK